MKQRESFSGPEKISDQDHVFLMVSLDMQPFPELRADLRSRAKLLQRLAWEVSAHLPDFRSIIDSMPFCRAEEFGDKFGDLISPVLCPIAIAAGETFRTFLEPHANRDERAVLMSQHSRNSPTEWYLLELIQLAVTGALWHEIEAAVDARQSEAAWKSAQKRKADFTDRLLMVQPIERSTS